VRGELYVSYNLVSLGSTNVVIIVVVSGKATERPAQHGVAQPYACVVR